MIAAAVAAATAPLTAKLAEVETAAKPPPATEPAKIWTKAELRKAIDDGQITEIQAEDVLERQREAQIARQVAEGVKAAVSETTTKQMVEEGLAAYKELIPELNTPGSEPWQRGKAQFDYLVKLGQPKSHATELVALQALYGPVDKLKQAKGAANEPETHQDGGSDEGPGVAAPKKLRLSGDEKRYYGDLINKGIYKDWAQVEAEMKFANQRLRAKHGAAVH